MTEFAVRFLRILIGNIRYTVHTKIYLFFVDKCAQRAYNTLE